MSQEHEQAVATLLAGGSLGSLVTAPGGAAGTRPNPYPPAYAATLLAAYGRNCEHCLALADALPPAAARPWRKDAAKWSRYAFNLAARQSQ